MKLLSAPGTWALLSFIALQPLSMSSTTQKTVNHPPSAKEQKIQVAILLDVSNSMDGLIGQAKTQLWDMVNVMGKVKCENGNPKIEIALYEYGRSTNDVKAGYVRQISPFTSDLDLLSQELFRLTTNGGDEYCGQVIHTSLDELAWDSTGNNYKVIFIAGNEDFLQGPLSYTQSCREAKKKGVIVNTIFCGDKMEGMREHWNLGSECGVGSYSNINQDAKEPDIPTPYDSTLIRLNSRINATYMAYGYAGAVNQQRQASVDEANFLYQPAAGLKRVQAKANNQVYFNDSWDLVDANFADSNFILHKLDVKTLPDTLKNKTRQEILQMVNAKSAERAAIRNEIASTSRLRENYIAAEKAKMANSPNAATLQTEMEKTIREQVKLFRMWVE